MLKNPQFVGWTGENVVIVGDSAGSFLGLNCIIRCIELGVTIPQGFCSIQGAFATNLEYRGPSLALSLFDPILNFFTIMKIEESYGGSSTCDLMNKDKEPEKKSSNFYTSPLWAPDEILKECPPTVLLTSVVDPCIDFNIVLAKRLRQLNVDLRLEVLGKVIHGFVTMTHVRQECLKKQFKI
jgi:acetyl esterase/lipase